MSEKSLTDYSIWAMKINEEILPGHALYLGFLNRKEKKKAIEIMVEEYGWRQETPNNIRKPPFNSLNSF